MTEEKEEKKILHAPAIITREGHSVGKSEEFKRPDHTDFMDSSELRDSKFSGIRRNEISNELEIWILGNKEGSMNAREAALYPKKWEALYREVFGLNDVTSVSR